MTRTETQPRSSKAIEADLEKLKVRADELQKKQGELASTIDGARQEQGELVARDEPADDVRTKLRAFIDETDGIARALEVIGRDVARLERELREVQLKESEAELRAQGEKYRSAGKRLAQELQDFAVERVAPLMVEIREAASRANVASQMSTSLVGKPLVAGQEPFPRDRLLDVATRETVELLLAYSGGRMPAQQSDSMVRQLQENEKRRKQRLLTHNTDGTPRETPAEEKEEVVAVLSIRTSVGAADGRRGVNARTTQQLAEYAC